MSLTNIKSEIKSAFLGFIVGGIVVYFAILHPEIHAKEVEQAKMSAQIVIQQKEAGNTINSQRKQILEQDSEIESLKIESEHTVNSLKTELSDLKEHTKFQTVKIVRPDGTIFEKTISETDSEQTSHMVKQVQDQFKQKIEQLQQSWKIVHEQEIAKLKQQYSESLAENEKKSEEVNSKKYTVTNPKKLGIEVGIAENSDIYLHTTYDVVAPIFVAVHLEKSHIGVGVGVRF